MQRASALRTPAAETYTAHATASPAVQSNKVYPTPCTTAPSISISSASDKRYSLGHTNSDIGARSSSRPPPLVFISTENACCDRHLDRIRHVRLGAVWLLGRRTAVLGYFPAPRSSVGPATTCNLCPGIGHHLCGLGPYPTSYQSSSHTTRCLHLAAGSTHSSAGSEPALLPRAPMGTRHTCACRSHLHGLAVRLGLLGNLWQVRRAPAECGLVSATYGIAGDGPPLLTKPSCLGLMKHTVALLAAVLLSLTARAAINEVIEWNSVTVSGTVDREAVTVSLRAHEGRLDELVVIIRGKRIAVTNAELEGLPPLLALRTLRILSPDSKRAPGPTFNLEIQALPKGDGNPRSATVRFYFSSLAYIGRTVDFEESNFVTGRETKPAGQPVQRERR